LTQRCEHFYFQASKLSGIARSRHQLSTLLKEAYENREALEEKIAQGKRNRKEAGNKYGTHWRVLSRVSVLNILGKVFELDRYSI
jgi:hypothetical protein